MVIVVFLFFCFGNVGWDFDSVPAVWKMSGGLDAWGDAGGGRVCGVGASVEDTAPFSL